MRSTPGNGACDRSRASAPVYSASHSRVIPPIVIGCAVKLIRPPRAAMPSCAVDADHADRVVDRPLVARAVDAEAGRVADRGARARGLHALPRGVDRARRLVGEHRGVALERRARPAAGDARAAREARRAVVVARVHRDRLGRDAGQLAACARAPRRRARRPAKTRSIATIAAVRSPSERRAPARRAARFAPWPDALRAAQHPTGSAERRRDVDARDSGGEAQYELLRVDLARR